MPLLPENYDQSCGPPCVTVPPGSVPGAKGDRGTNGFNGTAGANAYTTLTLSFVVPAVSGNVTVVVGSTAWMAVGQPVFISSAGTYQVAAINDATDVVLTNLGYPSNAAPTVVIAAGQGIVPTGLMGANGPAGGGVTSINISMPAEFTVSGGPVTTAGTIAVVSNVTQAANKVYATPNGAAGPATMRSLVTADVTSGVFPIGQGGTGQSTQATAFNALSPTTTKGDIIGTTDAPANVRIPVGADGQVFTANSAAAAGAGWAAPAIPLFLILNHLTSTPYTMLTTDQVIAVNASGAATVTLLTAPANGREVYIKDRGTASSNHITILAGAGDALEDAGSITTDKGYRHYVYDSTDKKWYLLGSA